MENNIFFKLKKNKFNPDIEHNLKQKEIERDNAKFQLSTNIYNPITNIIPSQIKNSNDLILSKDTTLSMVDIQKLILEKENERTIQNNLFKPIKTKMINNNSILESNNQSNNELITNTKVNSSDIKVNSSDIKCNRTNYLQTFEDLKRGSNINKQQNIETFQNKNNYNNILAGLKDLGIIK